MPEPVILYVEDDPTSRDVMRLLMTYSLKYPHVTIWEDSHDFAARLAALDPRPDLIFLDIHLQPYDGFQMLNMIRANPDFAEVLVIALTASVMNEEIDELQRAGFDGGVGKPISQKAFPGIVQRILHGEKIWFIV